MGHTRLRRQVLTAILLGTALPPVATGPLDAQAPPEACVVPGSGTLYGIGLLQGNTPLTPPACAPTHPRFSLVSLPLTLSLSLPSPLINLTNAGTGTVLELTQSGTSNAGALVARNSNLFHTAGFWNTGTTGGAVYAEANGGGPTGLFVNKGEGQAAGFSSAAVGNVTTVSIVGQGAFHTLGVFNNGTTAGALYAQSSASATANFVNVGSGTGLAVDTRGTSPSAIFANRSGGDAIWSDGNVAIAGNLRVTGNTSATGTKSAIVRTPDGVREFYTEEATEVWLTDYGFGHLTRGRAWIPLDTTFSSTLAPHTAYHVFVQSYEAASLVVTRRTSTGFEVRLGDLADPRRPTGRGANSEFSYRLVGKRRGFADRRLRRVPLPDSLVSQMP